MNLTQWTKRGFFITTLVCALVLQSVPLAIISVTLLGLLLIEEKLDLYIPTGLSIVTVLFIIVSLILGSYFNFYEKFPRLDDVLHIFYGAAFAVIGFIIIRYLSAKRGIRNDILVVCLFSFCFAVTGGALWEIYEYAFDTITGGDMQRVTLGTGVTDTMHDLIVETASAFLVNLYIYAYLKTGARNWVSRIVNEFIDLNIKRGRATHI